MTELTRTQADLDNLVAYLIARGHSTDLRGIRVSHDPVIDQVNAHNGRSFARVKEGDRQRIHVSKWIEDLPRTFRVGILLHELAHLAIPAMGQSEDDDEIKVDSWIIENLPEAGYHYEDVYYSDRGLGTDGKYPLTPNDPGHARLARNVQCVSAEFVGE